MRPEARLGWALWLAVLAIGCDADVPPGDGGGSFTPLVQPRAQAASAPRPDPALWETPLAEPTLEAGRTVWLGTCIACHSTGLGGAPLIGEPALWQPRLAQGVDTLLEHAVGGFHGEQGEMPPRGGNPALSDAQVRSAVLFMISKVQAQKAGEALVAEP